MRRCSKNFILYFVLSTGSILLFFGGPDYYAARSFKSIWNIGHILLFFTFTYVLLTHWNRLKKFNFPKQIIITVILTFIIGLLVELLQVNFSRTPELGDLWRDILGTLLSLFFLARSRRGYKMISLGILQFLLICMLIIELFYPIRSFADEIRSRTQFPVLANFETSIEIDRWGADERIERTEEIFHSGKACGKVYLTTEKYSGVSLKYFPRDWRGYRFLEFYIYHSNNKLRITCRIHDDLHIQNGQPFADRFNKRIILHQGWNQVLLPIEEIENAPAGRKMNLKKIMNIGLFASSLKSPDVIFIDDFRLIK